MSILSDQPQRVLFCGGRDWTDSGRVRVDVGGLAKGSIVIHGGAQGADDLAGYWARHLGYHVAQVDALWHVHGKAAGPMRNEAMMMLRPDFAFVYDTGGRGTADMKRRLARWNVPHVVHSASRDSQAKED